MRTAFQRVILDGSLVMAARVIGLAANFGTQTLLARLLQPQGLGFFYFASSIAYVGSMAAAFGYPVVVVRFISRQSYWGCFRRWRCIASAQLR